MTWAFANATDHGIDASRIGTYGESTGGCLVLPMALMARDRRGPSLRFIMSICTMLDDRHETRSSHLVTDGGVWDGAASLEAWDYCLGHRAADAIPERAARLRLPPSSIDIGEFDLFRDEDIIFSIRLMAAGVPTKLHVYPSAYHGSEVSAPSSRLSRRIVAPKTDALRGFVQGWPANPQDP